MIDTSPPPFRSAKRWGLLFLACLLLIACLAGLKYQQIQKAIAFAESFPERSAAVTAVTAETSSWTQIYRTIGEVRATRYVALRNEVEGRITAIGFVGGSRVDAGQAPCQGTGGARGGSLEANDKSGRSGSRHDR